MKCYFKMLSQGLQDVANVLKSAWALPSDVYFVYLCIQQFLPVFSPVMFIHVQFYCMLIDYAMLALFILTEFTKGLSTSS